MATLHPGPLQPVWQTHCQLLGPSVHLPLPLHRSGQPSAWRDGEDEKGGCEAMAWGWGQWDNSHAGGRPWRRSRTEKDAACRSKTEWEGGIPDAGEPRVTDLCGRVLDHFPKVGGSPEN